jgi:phospholipase C
MSNNRLLQSAIILGALGCGAFSSMAQVMPQDSAAGLSKLNHIIFMAQENRSLDHYFGELRQYWADNGAKNCVIHDILDEAQAVLKALPMTQLRSFQTEHKLGTGETPGVRAERRFIGRRRLPFFLLESDSRKFG